jgi:hypothetical protein
MREQDYEYFTSTKVIIDTRQCLSSMKSYCGYLRHFKSTKQLFSSFGEAMPN